ncbi:superinfection immunity protein [Leptospira sp. 96542]|nr:superinfection immunity protein [Leptospira sp. 96542]
MLFNLGIWEIVMLSPFITVIVSLYFLPSLYLVVYKKFDFKIFLFNLFFGWTVVGWIILMYMSNRHVHRI